MKIDNNNIFIRNYQIKIREVEDPASHDASGQYTPEDNVLGIFAAHELTIYIKKGLPEALLKDTLLHEILHAIWFISGCTSVDGSSYSEELVISIITSDIIEFIKNNNELLEYYIDRY